MGREGEKRRESRREKGRGGDEGDTAEVDETRRDETGREALGKTREKARAQSRPRRQLWHPQPPLRPIRRVYPRCAPRSQYWLTGLCVGRMYIRICSDAKSVADGRYAVLVVR